MPLLAWGLLLALSGLWGGSFLFNRVAVAEMPMLDVVFGRIALAALVLLAIARLSGIALPRDRASWRDYAVMGILNNVVPFCLIVWGQKTIGAGLASILNATTPIFGVIVAHLFTTDDRLTPARVLGIALAFAGVVVLVGPDALGGLGDHLLAEVACLGAAISYGFSALWSRRFRGRPPVATATGQLVCSAVMLAPAVLLLEPPWAQTVPGLPAVASVVALAVLSTAVAYVLFFRLNTMVGPTNTILVTFLIPPSAILLGVLVLGERLAAHQFAGMALIVGGLAAVDGRVLRRLGVPG